MPKRKRSIQDDASGPQSSGDRIRASRQRDVDVHIQTSKKLLHRALKTAKGFERQKLGKRLTNATKISDASAMSRLRKEVETVKSLDLDRVVDNRLSRGIAKIKVFAESGYLPEGWVDGDVKGWVGEKSEEEVRAWNNVVSGIWNLRVVKEVWEGVVRGFYLAMGIPAPVLEKGKGKKEKEKEKDGKKNMARVEVEKLSRSEEEMESEKDSGNKKQKREDREVSWEGFDSPADDEDEDSDSESEGEEDGNDSLDEETLSHYDALLANSSDEESFDEEQYLKSHPSTSNPSTNRLSLSLSPSPSRSPSPSLSIALSNSNSDSDSEPEPSPPPKSKKSKSKPAPPSAPTTGSTFLPTLMGGYWSGSESSASDLSDSAIAPPIRKNRMGQQARKALWEKKFGTGANHIKAGKGSVNFKEERGKGGARGRGGGKFGSRDRGGGGRDRDRDRDNANMTEVKPREKKRDDLGVLHPSWQAAKKAKEEKLKATFAGKKVTFD